MRKRVQGVVYGIIYGFLMYCLSRCRRPLDIAVVSIAICAVLLPLLSAAEGSD